MKSQEILEKYLNFYKSRGHKQIPNVSLVPEGDSTLLFVNSGMFPLVPYLSGQPHPLGKRLVNVQRSLRFEDIDDIGNNRHTIAFHMLGNWSLGDYFKKEQLPWAYEFFIEELGLDSKKLYATVFEGDEFAPKDMESVEIIKTIFAKYRIDAKEGERIFPLGRKNNWWQRGDTVGELGGPDSELFYFIGDGEPARGKNLVTNEEEFIEIGNSVFMQYRKTEKGWEPLAQKNVDFGGGLERTALAVQGKKDIFETDNFWPLIEEVQKVSKKNYYENPEVTRSMRILADHMRAATFLAMDGVVPSNKDQGYVLRRILRRMRGAGKKIGVNHDISVLLVPSIVKMFLWLYPLLSEKQKEIEKVFSAEEDKFGKTLERGSKEAGKAIKLYLTANLPITASLENIKTSAPLLSEAAFNLYQSFGYPPETFLEDLKEKGIPIDDKAYFQNISKAILGHQEQSRAGAEQKFKGGLADHSEEVVKYHTATHLLQRGLKNVLGDSVCQIGSNITGERLRFDFPFSRKLTDEEIKKTEDFVNTAVKKKLPVAFVMLPREKAVGTGALYIKAESYPSEVKVYYIGDNLENATSKEFCGGPHVENTSELGPIEIYKQESIGEGKMRVYGRFR